MINLTTLLSALIQEEENVSENIKLLENSDEDTSRAISFNEGRIHQIKAIIKEITKTIDNYYQ